MKTHLKNLEKHVRADGTFDEVGLRHDLHENIAKFESKQETLLGISHEVLPDGSVVSHIHHVAADGVGSHHAA